MLMGSTRIQRISHPTNMRLLIASLLALCFWSGTVTVTPLSSTHQLPKPVSSIVPVLLSNGWNTIERMRASTNRQTCQIQEASLLVSWGLTEGIFLQWFTDGKTFQVEGSSSWEGLPYRIRHRLLLALECVAAQNASTVHLFIPRSRMEAGN